MEEAVTRVPLPIFSYLIMPDHWHFVVRPTTDSELSEFLQWLTHTHTMRWHGDTTMRGLVSGSVPSRF